MDNKPTKINFEIHRYRLLNQKSGSQTISDKFDGIHEIFTELMPHYPEGFNFVIYSILFSECFCQKSHGSKSKLDYRNFKKIHTYLLSNRLFSVFYYNLYVISHVI